ncbi:hypothetical protein M3Y99_01419300 [Aphelenchoides fujianensis]|nr:hypothetical protein M3Y99_01419300 [Aphelenchoides fujianensis]
METAQNPQRFSALVSDTVARLQHCMQLINGENPSQIHATHGAEATAEPPAAEADGETDGAKKKAAAKRAKKNARRRNQPNAEEAPPPLVHLPSIVDPTDGRVELQQYAGEQQIGDVMRLIGGELSEPYSIYTYRYFINKWPYLCLLAFDTHEKKHVGVVVGKIDDDDPSVMRAGPPNAYIAMLAVDKSCRRMGIGTRLVTAVVSRMQELGCGQVVLETEVTNTNALNLYSRLGFIRERRYFRYYLSGTDAYRVKLYFSTPRISAHQQQQESVDEAEDEAEDGEDGNSPPPAYSERAE